VTGHRETLDSIGGLAFVLTDIEQQVTNANYQSVLEPFQSEIATREADMFSGQHDSNGVAWAPLAVSTAAEKPSSQMLFKSGGLEASLVHVGGRGNIASTLARGLLYGTDVPYAVFHQDGTPQMPARPPVGLSAEDLESLVDQIADQTVKNLKSKM
jgi:phage gpG-like protein